MKKSLVTYFATLVILSLNACSKDNSPDPVDNKAELDKLYQAAVTDAITADSSEICDTLWAINTDNPKLEWKIINNQKYVLAGNFNQYPSSYSDTLVKNSWGEIWIFIPAQFKNRMTSAPIPDDDTLLRMRQMLGLPRQNSNNYIVELWVKPADLYRPAADPQIDDNTAGLYLKVNTDPDYIQWFNQNIYDSYLGSGTHYPWTRLGYTFDWANPASEVGMSEYCIKTNSTLYVKKLSLATNYLNN